MEGVLGRSWRRLSAVAAATVILHADYDCSRPPAAPPEPVAQKSPRQTGRGALDSVALAIHDRFAHKLPIPDRLPVSGVGATISRQNAPPTRVAAW